MRIRKITGSICEIEATFVVRSIHADEFRFDRIIDFTIDLSNIADLSNYNIFLSDEFFNQNLDDLVIYDNPLYDEEFVTGLNNLTRSILLDNIDKIEGHLRDESILDENKESLDICEVNVLNTFNLRVVEGEVLTVLSADVDVQGYVTRKGFRGVYYKEYLDNISYAYEHIDEHDYYQEGVHL